MLHASRGVDLSVSVEPWSKGYLVKSPSFPHVMMLREAHIDEAPSLLALTKALMDDILEEAWQGKFDWDDWYEDLRKAIFSKNVSIYTIYIDQEDNFAGYAWFAEERDCVWLTSIMITSEWQGQGLGKIMMAFLEHRAREANKRYVRLGVQKNNTRALHFYLKLGFNAIDYIKRANTIILEKEVIKGRFFQNVWDRFLGQY